MKNKDKSDEEVWKKFLRKYWQMALVFIVVIIAAAVVALATFLWVLIDAQATGMVPSVLGEWTVGYCITFLLTVILWELLFVASWIIPVGAAIYFLWYKKLPEDEQEELSRDSSRSAGDGFEFVVGLVWLGIVWITGRWNLAFQSWTINDWVYTWLMACIPLVVLAGIAGSIYIAYSLSRD